MNINFQCACAGNQAQNQPQHATAAHAVAAADTVAQPAVLAGVAAEDDGDKAADNQQHVGTAPRHNANLNRQQVHEANRRGQEDENDSAKLGADKGDQDHEAAMLWRNWS